MSRTSNIRIRILKLPAIKRFEQVVGQFTVWNYTRAEVAKIFDWSKVEHLVIVSIHISSLQSILGVSVA